MLTSKAESCISAIMTRLSVPLIGTAVSATPTWTSVSCATFFQFIFHSFSTIPTHFYKFNMGNQKGEARIKAQL